MKRLLASACLALSLLSTVPAMADDSRLVDVTSLIRQSEAKFRGTFKLDTERSVAQMDTLLTQQYGASARISDERDPELKALYYDAATLILSGYPIAGGTLVQIARTKPGFRSSGAGQAFVSFVSAMLQPTDDDDDIMVADYEKAAKARTLLSTLRPELQLIAQVRAIGQIYGDELAIDAGRAGLTALKATPAERRLIDQAGSVK